MGVFKGTMITATVSGTTSNLTGGKFANGAVTGAFVHMFNDLVIENTKAASGYHRRLVVYNSNNKRLYGISFGVDRGESIWGGRGTVYIDYKDRATQIDGILHTTEAEDLRIISYMKKQVGQHFNYNVLFNNCRDFSANQFDFIGERILNR